MSDDDAVRCPHCAGTGAWKPNAEVARRLARRFTVVAGIVFATGYLLGMAVTTALGWAGAP